MKAIILMYHRVIDLESDPWSLSVSPEHFEHHLHVLRNWGDPIRLTDLAESAAIDKGSDRMFAVTFDDGYSDNLFYAEPLLKTYRIPSTVFVVSKAIGLDREFWWDKIEQIFLQPGNLPEVLTFEVGGHRQQFSLNETSAYSDQQYQEHRSWKTWQHPPTKRQSVFLSVWEVLRLMPETDRNTLLAEMTQVANVPATARPQNRILNKEQLVALLSGGAFEVGCHTRTHQRLSSLPMNTQREEIMQSKQELERILRQPVPTFAYPFGEKTDFTDETVRLISQAGFQCACTTISGSVHQGSDVFRLPRLYVGNWNRGEFIQQLSQWMS